MALEEEKSWAERLREKYGIAEPLAPKEDDEEEISLLIAVGMFGVAE